MKPNHPPQSTTRLENVSLQAGGVRFDLDGRPVNLTGDAAAPSVTALHAFHQSALTDFRTRRSEASAPGLFSRLKSWLGGLFGKTDAAYRRVANEGRDLEIASTFKSRQSHATADSSRHSPAFSGAVAEPSLHAAYADKEGVHLIWRPSPKKEPHQEVEFTCRLDSEVADRLQDCYGQLAKLGYKVTGLEVLREPEAKVDAALVAAERSADGSSPAIVKTAGGDACATSHREKRPPAMVLEVSAGPAKETGKGGNVLIAPDPLLLRALRAGADPERPAEERLTFLRGTLGKNGLKIIDVGLGEGKEHAPARWENATKWLEHQAEKNAVLEIKSPEPTP